MADARTTAKNARAAKKDAPETLGQKLRKLQAEIPEAFKSGNVKRIEELRTTITGLAKLTGELRTTFDLLIDKRDDGLFGENFAPTVTRIRQKSDTVGRPKKDKVDELASLDI